MLYTPPRDSGRREKIAPEANERLGGACGIWRMDEFSILVMERAHTHTGSDDAGEQKTDVIALKAGL